MREDGWILYTMFGAAMRVQQGLVPRARKSGQSRFKTPATGERHEQFDHMRRRPQGPAHSLLIKFTDSWM